MRSSRVAIMGVGLSVVMLHAWAAPGAFGAPANPPAELDAVKTQLFELLRQEGLGPEQRYLQGHFISRTPRSASS